MSVLPLARTMALWFRRANLFWINFSISLAMGASTANRRVDLRVILFPALPRKELNIDELSRLLIHAPRNISPFLVFVIVVLWSFISRPQFSLRKSAIFALRVIAYFLVEARRTMKSSAYLTNRARR